MRPTPMGNNAISAARQALRTLEQAVSVEDKFDPLTSRRTFRLCMTDVGQIAVLPALLKWLKPNAPALSIEVVSPRGEVERVLEVGEADVAIGVRLKRQKGIVGQLIFQECFACLVSKDHPRIRSSITKQEFLREAHVVPKILSSSMGSWMMDQTLSLQKVPRRIALQVPRCLVWRKSWRTLTWWPWFRRISRRCSLVTAMSGRWSCPSIFLHMKCRNIGTGGIRWTRAIVGCDVQSWNCLRRRPRSAANPQAKQPASEGCGSAGATVARILVTRSLIRKQRRCGTAATNYVSFCTTKRLPHE